MTPRVVQLLSGAGPYDAVTNQALAWQRILAAGGVAGDVLAAQLDPRLDGAVGRADRLASRVGPGDLVVVHYSAYAPALERALDLPGRKLLVYHNITPPHYLWEHEPYVAMVCALGRERLGAFAGRVDAAVVPSAFSARDLEAAGFGDVRVDRRLYEFDRDRLAPGADRPESHPAPTVVFVGRLSHNKRQDRIIKAFSLYQRTHAPDARLVLPGSPGSGTYGDHLVALAEQAGARNVQLPGALSQDRLNAIYAGADAFVCLSEHEGFCIPLLEALHFGLPVVARRAAAVPEVLGDAGVLLDDPDLATVAEAIDLCVRGDALRAELRERGERRLAEFAPAATHAAVRETVQALL